MHGLLLGLAVAALIAVPAYAEFRLGVEVLRFDLKAALLLGVRAAIQTTVLLTGPAMAVLQWRDGRRWTAVPAVALVPMAAVLSGVSWLATFAQVIGVSTREPGTIGNAQRFVGPRATEVPAEFKPWDGHLDAEFAAQLLTALGWAIERERLLDHVVVLAAATALLLSLTIAFHLCRFAAATSRAVTFGSDQAYRPRPNCIHLWSVEKPTPPHDAGLRSLCSQMSGYAPPAASSNAYAGATRVVAHQPARLPILSRGGRGYTFSGGVPNSVCSSMQGPVGGGQVFPHFSAAA